MRPSTLRTRTAEVDTELARARGKLANERFVAKAPPRVVQGERDKLEQLIDERERLAAELRALGEDADA